MSGLRWAGLFSDEKVTPRGNLLDTLCATLEAKMQYEKGERDMVMLQHKFEIENKDGSTVRPILSCTCLRLVLKLTRAPLRPPQETHTSTLLDFGAPVGSGTGPSSMARTVGIPCGIAVQLVLDGVISKAGVLAPYSRDIVDPIMEALEKEGITMTEAILSRSEAKK